ncbi:MAG: serine hydrolase [Gemmatimonadetes bacterium]|nr:serine hydrolase [Gemmatimonadota bacterium]
MPKNTVLEPGVPAEAGLSAGRLERATGLLQAALEEKAVTAAAIAVARKGKLVLSQGFGHLQPRAGSPEVQPDSIFLLASISKPVAACSVMQVVDRGLVSLDDPVNLHIPEFIGWERAKVRVSHLLSHVSGMPDMLPENVPLRRAHAPLSAFVEGAIRTRLLYEPGTSFRYQSKGILLAAEIVERVTGERLRDFQERELFAPLGMKRSALGLGGFAIPDTVWCGTTMEEGDEARSWGQNSPYWRDQGHPWGGMHSSATDLAVLLQTVLNGGSYGGAEVFSPAACAAMTADRNGHLDAPWGLGWALRDSQVWSFFGEVVSERTFGHVGATGTVAWADPERGLICVVLTNQMVAGGSLLRRVSNAVAAAVVD